MKLMQASINAGCTGPEPRKMKLYHRLDIIRKTLEWRDPSLVKTGKDRPYAGGRCSRLDELWSVNSYIVLGPVEFEIERH